MTAVVLLSAHTEICATEAFTGRGLVLVGDFQSIQGLSLQMPGESALPLAKGAYAVGLHAAESATILQEFTPTLTGVLKRNQLRTTLAVCYGLTSGTEIRLGDRVTVESLEAWMVLSRLKVLIRGLLKA